MASKVAEILETMEYGPAPESAAPATAWLDAHGCLFGMFIDGEWTAPGDDRLFDSVNPANGQPFAKLTQGAEDAYRSRSRRMYFAFSHRVSGSAAVARASASRAGNDAARESRGEQGAGQTRQMVFKTIPFELQSDGQERRGRPLSTRQDAGLTRGVSC